MNKSLTELRDRFLKALNSDQFGNGHEELYQPDQYILQLGGKRLRPVMLLQACRWAGGDADSALPAAIAIEYFHNFTLIHDDIMDEAPTRRGKETVHKKFGVNQAILSGDALLLHAYRHLAAYPAVLHKSVSSILTKTAIEVCEGQSLDMSFERRMDVTVDEYIEMIRLKTSVLFGAALKMGALIGGSSEEVADKLYDFGENLGIAFQIQDDILDTFGDDEVGKKIGGDILQNKKTMLLITALEKSTAANDFRLAELIQNDPSEEKIRSVIAIFDEYGIKEYAASYQDTYLTRALRSLEGTGLPGNEINEIASLLIDRRY